ncbi:MAG: DUF4276 family protein [Bacteroidia bacterium]|nr:DUF4276 family protein [Bacteroidia bacterium]
MAKIYVEGGGEGKDLKSKCREGFQKFIRASGNFEGRMPRIVACGGRNEAFNDFTTAHKSADNEFVALLVDSEDPLKNIDEPWQHLKQRDNWEKPTGASDEQVLLMTTSMETWIVADRDLLRQYFGSEFQESALPALNNLENKSRKDIFDQLVHSSRNCKNVYRKGERSFDILGRLNPSVMRVHLPSLERVINILDSNL